MEQRGGGCLYFSSSTQARCADVSDPLVLLAVDASYAAALHGALLARSPAVRVELAAIERLVEHCSTTRVDLLVLSANVDDSAGLRALTEMRAFASSPQTVVVFDDASDPRRAAVARAGAWDHVVGHAGDAAAREPALAPLLGLIDRLLASDARDARLDAQARQFRALVEASSDGVYILRDGRFSWANRRFQEMVGFSADELTSPDFAMAAITAPDSRDALVDRARRVDAGLPVAPRYEFGALKKSGQRFDAHVSIAYLDLEDGRAGALGIMQDITERKSFEQQLLKKNRELQLLNLLSASVHQAVALDETLRLGCRHILSILGARAAGFSLLSADRRTLVLRVSAGLPDLLARALHEIPVDAPTLLARAVASGDVAVVDDLMSDPRIAIAEVKEGGFAAAIVVPLKSRQRGKDIVVGAAFALLADGHSPTEGDRDLMIAIGNVLGNAIEKAALLEAETAAKKKLVALDDVALALASTLDADEVALTVARSTHRLFGAMRVLIARLEGTGSDDDPDRDPTERGWFVPVHVLDDGEPVASPVPIPYDNTVMGLSLDEKRPVQRVRPRESDGQSVDPLTGAFVKLRPYEEDLFRQGVGTAVAVPILVDGKPLGALWLGYPSTMPLGEGDLQVLQAIGTHVAIATKNATLFEGRERALEELRAAQKKLVDNEKLHAIGLIAHGVAHDFNNILGSILGRAQLLKAQLRDAPLIKHAEVIETAAQDGAETVRRIQELGRKDRLDDFVAVDAAGIVDDVVELTRPRWQQKSVRVTCSGAPGLFVAGNPSELREVLINLVHNAVDALPDDGSGVIDVDADLGPDGDRVVIRVNDNGSGIPKDVVDKIFDPYFTTKGKRGTGLGLSVSLSIVRRHGGEMRVESSTTAPKGTTFFLDLPTFTIDDDTPHHSLPPQAAVRDSDKAVVLVVDDEENIREILAEMLLTHDHEVITAADGAEALHKLKEHPAIDLVFTDLGLPGMSGFELAHAMKELRPDLLIALVTGWGATLDPEKARAQGVDMVISKPFRFEGVVGVVDEALAVKRNRLTG
jgi:PAS domain S-box-containing protein